MARSPSAAVCGGSSEASTGIAGTSGFSTTAVTVCASRRIELHSGAWTAGAAAMEIDLRLDLEDAQLPGPGLGFFQQRTLRKTRASLACGDQLPRKLKQVCRQRNRGLDAAEILKDGRLAEGNLRVEHHGFGGIRRDRIVPRVGAAGVLCGAGARGQGLRTNAR